MSCQCDDSSHMNENGMEWYGILRLAMVNDAETEQTAVAVAVVFVGMTVANSKNKLFRSTMQ